MADPVQMFNPAEGRTALIVPADVALARSQGWVDGAAPAPTQAGGASFAASMAERAASGATLGLSDVVLAGIGGDEYREGRAERDATWGGLGDIAEGVGAVAPALATGGESLAARGLAATPTGLAARLGTRLAGEGGAARLAAAGAAEGFLQGAGNQVSEEALALDHNGYDGMAERIFASGMSGAIFGGVAGGGLGLAAGGAGRLAKRFGKTADGLVDTADHAAVSAVMDGRGIEKLGRDEALDLGAFLRNYRKADGTDILGSFERPEMARAAVRDELNYLNAERQEIARQMAEPVEAQRALLEADRRAVLQQIDDFGPTTVPTNAPGNRAIAELETARKDAVFYKQQLSEAVDKVERNAAQKNLNEARARMKAAEARTGEKGVAPRPQTDAELTARQQLAEIDAELVALQPVPTPEQAARLAELDTATTRFGQVLDAPSPRQPEGNWVPMAGLASAVLHGNPLVGGAVAVAGAASREVGRRIPSMWAALTKRLAAGDPSSKIRGVLTKASGTAARTAGWALTEDEYQALRTQVRDMAIGDTARPLAIGEIAPQTEVAMRLVMMRAANHLERTAPTAPMQTDNPNVAAMVGQVRPDPHAVHTWARRVQAIDDPYSVLDNPTREGGEAIRDVYPKLFNEMRAALVEEVQRTSGAVSLQKKTALSMTFGIPLDPSLGSHVGRLNQLAYERLRQRREFKPKPGGATAVSRRIMSHAEEIETGENPR